MPRPEQDDKLLIFYIIIFKNYLTNIQIIATISNSFCAIPRGTRVEG